MRSSDPIRGFVMSVAAAFALWKGSHLHGRQALFAYLLAGLALAMAVWHFTRNRSRSRA